jgi:hypothetical protein
VESRTATVRKLYRRPWTKERIELLALDVCPSNVMSSSKQDISSRKNQPTAMTSPKGLGTLAAGREGLVLVGKNCRSFHTSNNLTSILS